MAEAEAGESQVVWEYTPCCPVGYTGDGFRYNTLLEPDPDASTGAEHVFRATCQACGRRIPLRTIVPEPLPEGVDDAGFVGG